MRSRCFREPRSERGAGRYEARNERRTKDLRKQIEQARPIQLNRSGLVRGPPIRPQCPPGNGPTPPPLSHPPAPTWAEASPSPGARPTSRRRYSTRTRSPRGPRPPLAGPERCRWIGRACWILFRTGFVLRSLRAWHWPASRSLLVLLRNLRRHHFPPNCIVPAEGPAPPKFARTPQTSPPSPPWPAISRGPSRRPTSPRTSPNRARPPTMRSPPRPACAAKEWKPAPMRPRPPPIRPATSRVVGIDEWVRTGPMRRRPCRGRTR